MRKPTKILLIVSGIVIAVPLVGAAIIAATFDPNEYKPLLVDLVRDKTQRTLAIPGDLSLSFFPRIGVELGQTSLSARNSQETFASIKSAQLSMEVLPLLSGRLVVDHVLLDGLQANLRRASDGSTNVDDLLAQDEKEPKQDRKVDFSVDGIRITNADLVFDDQQQKRRLQASSLELETGHLAEDVPSKLDFSAHVKGNNPQIDADVALQGDIQFNLQQQRYAAKDIALRLNGAYADWKDLAVKLNGNVDIARDQLVAGKLDIDARGTQGGRRIEARLSSPELALRDKQVRGGGLRATAQLAEGDRNLAVNFTAPAFEGSQQSFTLPSIALEATLKQPQTNAKASVTGTVTGNLEKMLFASPQLKVALEGTHQSDALQGTLVTPFSADLNAGFVDMPKVAASFTLPNPGGDQIKVAADGNMRADLEREHLSLALKGKLDESQFTLHAGMKGYGKPAYQFNVALNEINLDRYRSAKAQSTSAPTATEQEQAIDLSALKDLTVDGSLRVGALKAANISASNVRMDVRVANGKADIAPLEARLYGGALSGSVSAIAASPSRFAVAQRLTGVNIGPLLQDAMGKQAPVDGKGNVQFNVTAQGATVSQLTKALNGRGEIDLRDGAVRGVNIARVIRNARANLQRLAGNADAQSGEGSANEQTDFSELRASFDIKNGVLHNNDLSAKSPLLRVAGEGSVNLVEETLNYLVKATVVSTLKGQGGAELDALKGVTVPVRLTGPFTAPAWKIDAKSLIGQQVQQELEQKKEAVRARAKEEINTQREQAKEKLQEQLKDRFKGLLGN